MSISHASAATAQPLPPESESESAAAAPSQIIAPYVARFGRSRPIVAVVGENSGTVLSDYVIPYGVLAQSGVAEVIAVATQPGPLTLAPLHIAPDATVAQFDSRFPDGADYDVGLPVSPGVDEIALALTAEACSATLRSRVYTVARSAAPIKMRGGVTLLPDMVEEQGRRLDWMLAEADATPAAQVLDKALADITARYGATAARFVKLEGEYP
ncbi:MAG TPA: hypothetical protein DCW29_02580 [Janthinobacterium sp.]|nr:hypothetical protein [Janthinobacterium sp.]